MNDFTDFRSLSDAELQTLFNHSHLLTHTAAAGVRQETHRRIVSIRSEVKPS